MIMMLLLFQVVTIIHPKPLRSLFLSLSTSMATTSRAVKSLDDLQIALAGELKVKVAGELCKRTN